MTDVFTKATRSWIMGRITGRDTLPEMAVRRFLHARGYRFRLHRKDLPGRPDIVLAKYRTAIQVHGCFWHGHSCKDGRRPASNSSYWNQKLDRNLRRDRRNARKLRQLGWRQIVVWECQVADEARLEKRVLRKLESQR
jgi:DNA mismatch endonuclease (patch repair protein)